MNILNMVCQLFAIGFCSGLGLFCAMGLFWKVWIWIENMGGKEIR